jgi:hypothetical protein
MPTETLDIDVLLVEDDPGGLPPLWLTRSQLKLGSPLLDFERVLRWRTGLRSSSSCRSVSRSSAHFPPGNAQRVRTETPSNAQPQNDASIAGMHQSVTTVHRHPAMRVASLSVAFRSASSVLWA